MISFGPIPSRRLGKSLGINNIPSQKICSYSCMYCQVGLTRDYSVTRKPYYEPIKIFKEVEKHLHRLQGKDMPDYLTFVANGEPTLDIRLGEAIQLLKSLNIPIAVITNASLINDKQVRGDLMFADWVSVKIDSADEAVWKTINRPHVRINFSAYIDGLFYFANDFKGKLVSETMLVKGINDKPKVLQQTADLVSKVNPMTAYISIPTRPPAVSTVVVPDEIAINEAYQIFSEKGIKTELILGFEGTDTGFTGNAREDILNICAVHPIREDTMQELLLKDHADISLLNRLIQDEKVQELEYKSKKFYLRKHNL
jgi:wyosine [tRNA(Phe)-imidazoG37] synthetase (radical SAM superfamily)